MSGRVLRWQVPINDRDHLFMALPGDLLGHIAASLGPPITGGDYVEFWTFAREAVFLTPERTFRVFGTGHLVPDGYEWRGTAPRVSGLVFHLFELVAR